uniref:Uncharacterized protein n=1 Tax=Coturnix japonica TaxID=93934 RepID=A0A8C2U9D2_COTJA
SSLFGVRCTKPCTPKHNLQPQLPAHTTQQRLPTVNTSVLQDALRSQCKMNPPKKANTFYILTSYLSGNAHSPASPIPGAVPHPPHLLPTPR